MEMEVSTYEVFNDAKLMIELVTRQDSNATELAVFDGKKVTYEKRFPGPDGNTYIPPRGIDCFPLGINLASSADEYEDVTTLFDELYSFIEKYIDMDKEFINICVLYVLMTYVYQKFDTIPYLRIVGDAGSGKSTLTRTLSLLCYKGMEITGCVTVPVIFRSTDLFSPTLTIDETDFADQKDSADLIKLLNGGYAKGRPVIRLIPAEGRGFITESFNVYCPKILNGRRRFDNDALESRCISYRMQASTARPNSYQLSEEYYQEAQLLRNKLLKYRFDYFFKTVPLQVAECKIPNTLPPRFQQLMIPLMTVAVDDTSRNCLIRYFLKLEEDAKFGKAHGSRAFILKAVKTRMERKLDLLIGNICNSAREMTNDKFLKITPRKVGGILRDTFGLETCRTAEGYELIADELKLKQAYEDYGIGD